MVGALIARTVRNDAAGPTDKHFNRISISFTWRTVSLRRVPTALIADIRLPSANSISVRSIRCFYAPQWGMMCQVHVANRERESEREGDYSQQIGISFL